MAAPDADFAQAINRALDLTDVRELRALRRELGEQWPDAREAFSSTTTATQLSPSALGAHQNDPTKDRAAGGVQQDDKHMNAIISARTAPSSPLNPICFNA
jgi:hypothetical protein